MKEQWSFSKKLLIFSIIICLALAIFLGSAYICFVVIASNSHWSIGIFVFIFILTLCNDLFFSIAIKLIEKYGNTSESDDS